MRPPKQGIPKVVIVITDGRSNDKNATIREARLIRERGFSMISVGVGAETDQDELNGMSSSPDNVYSVEDFAKILEIVTDITRTNCKTPAEISDSMAKTQVRPNAYKYFEYPISTSSSVYRSQEQQQLVVELEEYSGTSQLFYSFEETNPKSDSDFLDLTEPADSPDENFFDDLDKTLPITGKAKAAPVGRKASACVDDKTLKRLFVYQVANVNNSGRLYLSVKGVGEEVSSIRVNVRLEPVGETIKLVNGQARTGLCQKIAMLSFVAILYFY